MSALVHQRLYHQQIIDTRSTQPRQVVAQMGALQAQDYSGAKWSIGLRLPGSSDATIEQALNDKAILRTWVMRGTLHIVAAADIRWLLELFGPRIIASSARRYRELELDTPTLMRSNSLLANALRDGQALDRNTLMSILEQNDISTVGQRSAFILQRACYDRLIAQTVSVRNMPVYIALDAAVPPSPALTHEQALAELAQRYFTTRGPATIQDFAWWSGLPLKDAKVGLAAVQTQLVSSTIDAQTYWMPAISPSPSAAAESIHLLPGFDEYLLSYRDRGAMLHPQYAPKVVPGNNGMFMPTIVLNGRTVGLWKRTIAKGRIVVMHELFASAFNATEQRSFADAAQRYGAFLGLPVEVVE